MKLLDLIDRLQEIAEELDEKAGDTDIRIAEQPSWPFENRIFDAHLFNPEDAEGEEEEDESAKGDPVVYIVDGGQIGYLPSAVRREISWG